MSSKADDWKAEIVLIHIRSGYSKLIGAFSMSRIIISSVVLKLCFSSFATKYRNSVVIV